jgi:multicomponent Na+:H+ antiporter subunit G
MLDAIAVMSIVAGLGFFAAGSIGLIRLPDLFSRLHALTKADNLGLGLLALGIALIDGTLVTALKLLLVWLLVLAASAASAHLIARHALQRGDANADGERV